MFSGYKLNLYESVIYFTSTLLNFTAVSHPTVVTLTASDYINIYPKSICILSLVIFSPQKQNQRSV